VLRIVQKELQADDADVTLRCGTRSSHEESLPVAHRTIPGLKEGVHPGRVDEGQVLEIQDDRRDPFPSKGANFSLRIGAVARSSSPLSAIVTTPFCSCDRVSSSDCSPMAGPFLAGSTPAAPLTVMA
jgi:hypothetical protein